MDVTLQYFDGCPNWQAAHDLVRQALRDVGSASEVTLQAVPTAEEAEAVGFRGSPTVLVDGVDPFTGARRSLRCDLRERAPGRYDQHRVMVLERQLRLTFTAAHGYGGGAG